MRRRTLMQAKEEDKWNYIMCKLNITTTTARTNVISTAFTQSDQIDYITFNERDSSARYDFDTSYQFTWAGERIMYIHFKQNTTTLANLFANITCVTYIDMNELDTNNVTSMNGMCMACTNLIQCLLSNCSAASLISTVNMFNSCTNLKYVDFGSYITGNFKPRKITDMRNMFNWCHNITSINMSMFDMSTVLQFGLLWGNCTSLTEIYISTGFNTNATITTSIFSNLTTSGIIYYNTNYNVDRLTNVMPSGWTLIPYNY